MVAERSIPKDTIRLHLNAIQRMGLFDEEGVWFRASGHGPKYPQAVEKISYELPGISW